MPPLAACDSDASVREGGQRQGYSSVTAATSARQINASSTVELGSNCASKPRNLMAGWWCDRRAFHDTVATLVVPPIPTGLRVERLGMHEHGFFFDPEPRRELFLRIERPCAKAVSAVPLQAIGARRARLTKSRW